MEYFKTLMGILIKPRETAISLKTEEGSLRALKFLVFCGLISTLLLVIPYLVLPGYIKAEAAQKVSFLIFSISLSYVLAGIIHLSMKLLGDSKGFYQSYKSVAYSSAVEIPFALYAFSITHLSHLVIILFFLWYLAWVIVFLKMYSDLSTTRFIISTMFIILLHIILIIMPFEFFVYNGFFV